MFTVLFSVLIEVVCHHDFHHRKGEAEKKTERNRVAETDFGQADFGQNWCFSLSAFFF